MKPSPPQVSVVRKDFVFFFVEPHIFLKNCKIWQSPYEPSNLCNTFHKKMASVIGKFVQKNFAMFQADEKISKVFLDGTLN